MKKGSKKQVDPTLGEVLEVVQMGFGRMDADFSEMHQRIEKVERGLRAIHSDSETTKEKVDDIHRRVVNLEHRTEDIRDTAEGIASAVDKDALTVLDHERRIRRLEKSHA